MHYKGGEGIADAIMRRRPIKEWAEPAQKCQLPVAEAGDVGNGFRPGQHRQQRQEQHLVERIHHLRSLTRIRQIIEMA